MEQVLSYYLKKLIPIVGEEVFFVREGNVSTPLRSYIVERFFAKFSDKKERNYSEGEIEGMKKDGYYGISMLRNAFKDISDFEFYYSTIVNEIKKEIYVHPTVASYIQTVRPPLILTTSPFKLLDDCFPDYKSLWYYPAEEANFKDISVPTICHIFGKAGECNVKWVVGEEELLDFLHAWNNGKSLDNNFISRFQEQGLLVLGCASFPNWIFRFLWYPLGKGCVKNERGFLLGNKTALKDHSEKEEETIVSTNMSFAEFLKRINYEKYEDLYKSLNTAIEQFKQDNREDIQQTHDFFISYASEDRDLAIKIKDTLKRTGLSVWLDKDRPRDLDGRYWAGIDRAIENSRYFMPIVTRHYVERFFSKSRIRDNIITALENETGRIIAALQARYNDDEDTMLSKIIPIMKIGEKVSIFHRNKEIEEDLNVANIDKYSNLSNPHFWIFNQINFKFYSENTEEDTFSKADWSIYKQK